MPTARTVLFLIFTFLGVPNANAMSCTNPKPIEHIGSTDIVFYGKVIRGGRTKPDGKKNTVTFEIIRAYKGASVGAVAVEYVNDFGGNFGWGFRDGDTTLVFASKVESRSKGIPQGRVNYCNMIMYHARLHLHPTYWDILAKMK